MRILSVGLRVDLFRKLKRKVRYIFDEAYDIDDSSNFLIFREYDLILVYLDEEISDTLKFVKRTVEKYNVPIIVLSTIKDTTTEIMFLRNGAVDYITDFDIDIIAARIDSKLRRTVDDKIEIGDMQIDIKREVLIYKGKEITDIRGRPFDILVYLIKHKNQVVSKDKLLNAIWEEPEYITPNVIETSINSIRQKLDKSIGAKCIETVRRRGYKFKLNF